jgi:hypothetical protein
MDRITQLSATLQKIRNSVIIAIWLTCIHITTIVRALRKTNFGSEVHRTVILNGSVFLNITVYSPDKVNRRFGQTLRFHLQDRRLSQASSYEKQAAISWSLSLSTSLWKKNRCSTQGQYGAVLCSGEHNCWRDIVRAGEWVGISPWDSSPDPQSNKWIPILASASCSCVFTLCSVIYLLLNIFDEKKPRRSPCLLSDYPCGDLTILRTQPQRFGNKDWLLCPTLTL